MREACRREVERRGPAGLAMTAAGELFDLLRLPLRHALGTGPRVTDWTPPAPARFRRGPQMFIEDFRRAASRLRSSVATLALTVGMLAVAIGVTAAMFTVLDALVLHPVPFREASRLTSVVLTNGEGFMSTVPSTLLGAWRDSRVFEGIEGAAQSPVTLDTGQELVTRGGARITPGMLAMLGVQPIIGRGFLEGEGRAGADDRILLSEELWQTLFNRDPGVIGRRIRVSGVSTEVIGVLPASFRFPYANVRAWRPIDFTAPPPDLQRVRPMAFARLAAGIPPPDSLRAAESAARSASALPDGTSLMFRPMAAGMVDKYSRRSIMTLSGRRRPGVPGPVRQCDEPDAHPVLGAAA